MNPPRWGSWVCGQRVWGWLWLQAFYGQTSGGWNLIGLRGLLGRFNWHLAWERRP